MDWAQPGPEDARVDVKVSLRLARGSPTSSLRTKVDSRSRLTLWRIEFPCLHPLTITPEDPSRTLLAVPDGFGHVYKGFKRVYRATYHSG